MLTEFQKKALAVIKDKPGIKSKQFAELMWPGSDMHKKVSNQGNGACKGKAAWLCGGSYLGKLRAAGLIKHDITSGGNRLTESGEIALRSSA